jgi:hypothetical protein
MRRWPGSLFAIAAVLALPTLFAGQRVAAPIGPPGPPGTASIEGIVLRAGSNEPVSGILVSISANAAAVAPHAPVESDAQGRFAFATLDAGNYRLTFEGEGFVRQQYGQRVGENGVAGAQAIVVAAGQAVKGISMSLTPTAVLSGRVHDSTGRPLAASRIQLVRSEYNNYGEKSLRSFASGRSDDRGLYRISGIIPGRYFLVAGGTAETSSNPNELPETTAVAFYPGVADLASASPIEILPADDKTGMDFILRTQSLHRISGHVIDEEHGNKLERLTVSYIRPSLTSGGGSTLAQSDPATGEFEIRDLASGMYSVRVQATFQGDGGRGARFVSHFAAKEITVGDSDVGAVVFTTRAASTILGRFNFESTAPPSPVRATLALRPVVPGGAPTSSMPDSSGNFEIPNVPEDEYRVSASGIAPPYYVKSVRYGGVEMLGGSFRYQHGDDRRMEVTVASGLSQLSGNVVDDRLQPVTSFAAVLIPSQRDRTDLYRTARVGGAPGHFTFASIPPGSYKVFVWDSIDPYSYFDPEMLKKYESSAKAVEIIAATDTSIEMKVTATRSDK